MGYIAFVLSEQSRKDIKAIFPPRYEMEVCHHVTLIFGDTSDSEKAWCRINLTACVITGHYDDKRGLECLSAAFIDVEDEDLSHVRFDGGFYHITHSLDVGRKPVESNNVVWKPEYLVRPLTLSVSGTIEVID